MLGDNGAVIVDKLEATGAEKLEDLRSLITARPITAVATGLAAGILLRSVFRGPVSTLLLMGGATYLGARYAARA
ncbi:MAG TPA: hypothetical protein VGC41_14765, partial [Kofleriaceae bacterium]